ncbi:hypothetical protein BT93_J1980 [Corymbia citriodora subsp. variegata]|nr:hypothetical protein BT93_J1980 [Corymbia citriodora subsp. variegata]
MACNSELPMQVLVRNLVLFGETWCCSTPAADGALQGDGRGGGNGDTSKNAADLSSPDGNDELEPPTGLMDTPAEMEAAFEVTPQNPPLS